MDKKPHIGKIIKEQRKGLNLSLNQLSKISGVSVAHLGRIEQGLRQPSPYILQKMAKPLGFDLDELLTIGGFLSPNEPLFSEEERDRLREELHTLLDRVATDSKRIKEITGRLLRSS